MLNHCQDPGEPLANYCPEFCFHGKLYSEIIAVPIIIYQDAIPRTQKPISYRPSVGFLKSNRCPVVSHLSHWGWFVGPTTL
jgi:hypothetical protein